MGVIGEYSITNLPTINQTALRVCRDPVIGSRRGGVGMVERFGWRFLLT